MLILIAFFPTMYDIPGIINGSEAIPYWVIIMISLSLGLGTMVGWKRIVITIGEKIGKDKKAKRLFEELALGTKYKQEASQKLIKLTK